MENRKKPWGRGGLGSYGTRKNGIREGEAQGEKERLPERSMKIVCRPQSNYPSPLACLPRAPRSFRRPVTSKRLLRTLGWRGNENKTINNVGVLSSLNQLGFYCKSITTNGLDCTLTEFYYDIIFPRSKPNITRK